MRILLLALFCTSAFAGPPGTNHPHWPGLEGVARFSTNQLKLSASETERYPAIRFHDKAGRFMGMMTLHEETNVKSDGTTYLHNHWTWYARSDTGGPRGVMYLTIGHEKEQFQLANGTDLVLKSEGGRFIVRRGSYYELELTPHPTDPALRIPMYRQIPWSDVHKANIPAN